MNNLKKLIAENEQLLNELEFWKSVAVELYTPEDAYEEFLRDIPGLHHEIDYDNMGLIR